MTKKDEKTGTEMVGQITKGQLTALLKADAKAKEDRQGINSVIGAKIADAVENKHLHKKAYGTLKMMSGMSNEALNDYWTTLLYYVDISGVGKRAAEAPRLGLGDGAEEEEDDEDDEVENGGRPGAGVHELQPH